jgi:hypothetical protein
VTISTTSSLVVALGTGSLTVFDFSFVGVAASDIEITYTDANGNATLLPSSEYTLSLNAPGVGQLWGIGGSVTYPLSGSPIAVGTSLAIERILPLVQLTSVANQGDFYPNAIEQALDYLTMITQQITDAVYRVVQGPPSDPTGLNYQLPAVAQRAQQVLGFDSSGNVIAAQPASALVSTAMQPIVAASTLAAAAALFAPAMIGAMQTEGAIFSSGTVQTFPQATAPTGWTQVTSLSDMVLRAINNTTGGSTGGSWTISGTTVTVATHVLALSELPGHTHNIGIDIQAAAIGSQFNALEAASGGGFTGTTDNGAGGGGAHGHPGSTFTNDGNWRPAFVNVLVASKD